MNPPNPPSPVKSHHSPRYSYPPHPHHHHDHSPTLSSPRTFAPSSSSANVYREDANAVSSAKSPRERGPRTYYDPILDGRDVRVSHLPLFIHSPTMTICSPLFAESRLFQLFQTIRHLASLLLPTKPLHKRLLPQPFSSIDNEYEPSASFAKHASTTRRPGHDFLAFFIACHCT